MLTQSRLREILSYAPAIGVFTRLVRSSNRIRAGDIAGHVSVNGYREICIDGQRHYAHRLAWLFMTGAFPETHIDHVNGLRDDNRWVNLREATVAQNSQNRRMTKNNTSGFVGVSWSARDSKWEARIEANKQIFFLGYFDDKREARDAYLVAKSQHHTFNPSVRR